MKVDLNWKYNKNRLTDGELVGSDDGLAEGEGVGGVEGWSSKHQSDHRNHERQALEHSPHQLAERSGRLTAIG